MAMLAETTMCTVCRDSLGSEDNQALHCMHVFRKACLDEWMSTNNTDISLNRKRFSLVQFYLGAGHDLCFDAGVVL